MPYKSVVIRIIYVKTTDKRRLIFFHTHCCNGMKRNSYRQIVIMVKIIFVICGVKIALVLQLNIFNGIFNFRHFEVFMIVINLIDFLQ